MIGEEALTTPFPRPQTITFTMPADTVEQYRAWKQNADHAYLRAELEKHGSVMIASFKGERCFDRITELPAFGDAEPAYGTFGGGFLFVFRPHRDSCDLAVTAPTQVEPISLTVPAPELLYEPIKTPGDYGILEEASPDDVVWRFAISTPRFEHLIKWGWDAGIIGAYSYTFTPTNVGCIVNVNHETSGEQILLADADAF